MTDTLPRLWGRRSSSNVQKVMWALAEIGQPCTQIEVGGRFGGLDTDEFLAMNPVGKVPVWQEVGLTLGESHAILRHLARTRDTGHVLMPADPAAQAVADQWMEVAITTFLPAVIAVFWQSVRLPVDKRDPDRLAAAVTVLDAATTILETRLTGRPWLGGDRFTLADIAAGVAMYRYWDMPVRRPERPALARWTQRLQGRTHYRTIVETSYDDLRG